jgi:hypothetical protein
MEEAFEEGQGPHRAVEPMLMMMIFVNNTIYILLQFNALKHQLSTQRCEPSTTAHMVRKLLTAVVAFGTTIPNRPSIITLFGCF